MRLVLVREDWEDIMPNPIARGPWRTVELVVASAVAVAFGVVFWAWSALWSAVEPAFAAFPPARALLYGMWLLPAVLGALIIRRPGASIYCETIAAVVSAVLGSQWGMSVLFQGMLQGLAAEVVFLALLYRVFTLPVAAVAGAAAGAAATLYDAFVWYPGTSWTGFLLPYIGCATISSLVVAGVGGWLLTRALAATGALDLFPAGRERAPV